MNAEGLSRRSRDKSAQISIEGWPIIQIGFSTLARKSPEVSLQVSLCYWRLTATVTRTSPPTFSFSRFVPTQIYQTFLHSALSARLFIFVSSIRWPASLVGQAFFFFLARSLCKRSLDIHLELDLRSRLAQNGKQITQRQSHNRQLNFHLTPGRELRRQKSCLARLLATC